MLGPVTYLRCSVSSFIVIPCPDPVCPVNALPCAFSSTYHQCSGSGSASASICRWQLYFEHFIKLVSLYLEARIRIWIRIKVKGWIRIRIHIKVKRRSGSASKWQPGSGSASRWYTASPPLPSQTTMPSCHTLRAVNALPCAYSVISPSLCLDYVLAPW